jgi:hypothetical protein
MKEDYPKTDRLGRRYKEVIADGQVLYREYEPTIRLNGLEVPISEADAVRKKMREADRAYQAMNTKAHSLNTNRINAF